MNKNTHNGFDIDLHHPGRYADPSVRPTKEMLEHALVKELGEGESVYMQRFDEDGDPDEDYAHELLRDDTGLLEYLGGERMWA